MGIPKWSEKYATGIKAIDRDHMSLFEEIGILSKALSDDDNPEHINEVIACLENYAIEHFSREEQFLIKSGYPKTEAHIRIHKNLLRKIDCLKSLYAEDPEQIDRRKIVHFLSDWLSEHILKVDMDYVPHLHDGHPDSGEKLEQNLHEVSISIPEKQRAVFEGFVRIISSDNPVARELTAAILHFEKKLEEHDMEEARKLFCL